MQAKLEGHVILSVWVALKIASYMWGIHPFFMFPPDN